LVEEIIEESCTLKERLAARAAGRQAAPDRAGPPPAR